MIDVRSDRNAQTFFSIRTLRRLVALSLVFAVASTVAAKAETLVDGLKLPASPRTPQAGISLLSFRSSRPFSTR